MPDLAPLLEYLPFAGLFIGALIVFEVLRQTLTGGESLDEARVRRLRTGHGESTASTELLRNPKSTHWTARIPVFGTLPQQMQQAGMRMGLMPLIALCVVVAVGVFAVWSTFLGILPGLALALLAGFGIPVAIISHFRTRRIAAFTEQLPDALDLMMRGLRIGHPINAIIHNVASAMPDPIGTEFARMSEQIAYGENLTDAFFDLADRIDQEDMHYLAVSIGIQHGTGGNLAQMLNTLSKVIRRRGAMRRRVKDVSSEGRISSVILSCLPILIFGFTSVTAPNYYIEVQDDPLFWPMAVVIVVLLVANFLVLRKLTTFRI